MENVKGMSNKWRGISDDIAHDEIVKVIETTEDGFIFTNPNRPETQDSEKENA